MVLKIFLICKKKSISWVRVHYPLKPFEDNTYWWCLANSPWKNADTSHFVSDCCHLLQHDIPVLWTVPWFGKNAFTSHQLEKKTKKFFRTWSTANLNKNRPEKKCQNSLIMYHLLFSNKRWNVKGPTTSTKGTSIASQADGFPGHGWQCFSLWVFLEEGKLMQWWPFKAGLSLWSTPKAGILKTEATYVKHFLVHEQCFAQ